MVGKSGRLACVPLGAAAVLLLAVYAPAVEAAVSTWWRSTAYGHCFLVLPVAAWLAAGRRDALARAGIRPLPWAALLALPLAFAWLAAERLGVMEAEQLVLVAMAWTLALAFLGMRATRAMAVPLLYLVFLVPFGAFLVPALQRVTVSFIDTGLSLLDIPHVATGTLIEIPEGTFDVAEACAGLRFLIASIAFGVLYAAVIYRSAVRRLVFVAASIVVPIVANGVRALGIVLLGHLRGSAEAGAADHLIYGWVFFSAVIVLLVALGLPFRQDTHARPATPAPRAATRPHGWSATAAVGLALLAASSGRAAALALDASAARPGPVAAGPVLRAAGAPPPGCAPTPAVGSGAALTCGAARVSIAIERLSARSGSGPVIAALRRSDPIAVMDAAGEIEDVRVSDATLPGATWRQVALDRPELVAASSVFFDGSGHVADLATRVALARASLSDGPDAVVARVVARGDSAGAATTRVIAWLTPALARPPR